MPSASAAATRTLTSSSWSARDRARPARSGTPPSTSRASFRPSASSVAERANRGGHRVAPDGHERLDGGVTETDVVAVIERRRESFDDVRARLDRRREPAAASLRTRQSTSPSARSEQLHGLTAREPSDELRSAAPRLGVGVGEEREDLRRGRRSWRALPSALRFAGRDEERGARAPGGRDAP